MKNPPRSVGAGDFISSKKAYLTSSLSSFGLGSALGFGTALDFDTALGLGAAFAFAGALAFGCTFFIVLTFFTADFFAQRFVGVVQVGADTGCL